MARTGGEKTRKRILTTAEKLFSEKGFDATSVGEIARSAGVNKALIYYHFKNKNDLILSLFRSIIEEVAELAEQPPDHDSPDTDMVLKRKVQKEIEFVSGRKRILALMLSEALRSDQRDDFLFRCAELFMHKKHGEEFHGKGAVASKRDEQQHMVYEFFTGFIPMVMFITLRDKYCHYFKHGQNRIVDDFVEAFARSHLASKHKQE